MGRVLTNNLSFSYAIEASSGILPSSPTWKLLEPNRINAWGNRITTVARNPISKNRQRRKGTITDRDQPVEYEGDITLDAMVDFLEGFLMAEATGGTVLRPASVDGSGNYTIVSTTQPYLFAESLVYVRGLPNTENNGLKVLDSVTAAVAAAGTLTLTGNPSDGDTVTIGSTVYTWETGALDAPYKVDVGADAAASIVNLVHAINGTGTPGTHYATGTSAHPSVTAVDGAGDTVVVTAITAGSAGNSIATTESGANHSWGNATLTGGSDLIINVEESTVADASVSDSENATMELCGYRGATGDLQINSDGDLISSVLDFTTLGLTVGQGLWIGGSATANKFATAANYGMTRIEAIVANKVTLNKRSQAFATDAGTGKNIYILFGRFIRNVAVDHSDWLERTFQFEAAFPNLGDAGATRYQYSTGNACDQITMELPLADKATFSVGFVGLQAEDFTGTRKTNAASAREPVGTTAFNTSQDIVRLRVQEVDETGLTTDFKSFRMTITNNVSPEKVLGQVGAKYTNYGSFFVDIAATLLFTDEDVVDAISNNTTIGCDFVLRNGDGGLLFDLPSGTLGDGRMDLPVNQSVQLNISLTTFEDDTLGTSLGVTLFPYLPSS